MRVLGYNIKRSKTVQKDISIDNIGAKGETKVNFMPLGFTGLLGGSNYASKTKGLNTSTPQGQRNAYVFCPAVMMVINRKVSMSCNAEFKFQNSKGNAIRSQWQRLIDKPNPQTNWTEFWQYLYTLIQIHGHAYIYKRVLPGISHPELYVMPNWDVTIAYKTGNEFFDKAESAYQWTRNGRMITIQPEYVIILSDTGFDLSNSYFNYEQGGSRLIPLGDATKNIIAAYEARGNLLIHGKKTIVAPEPDKVGSVLLPEDDRKKLEGQYENNYGYMNGQSGTRVATIPIKATTIGFNAADMAGFEEVKEDVNEVIRGYGMNPYMFGVTDSTFNNQKEALKGGYTNAVVPETNSIIKQFCAGVGITDNFVACFDDVEELQENMTDQLTAMSRLIPALGNLITLGVYTAQDVREIIAENINIELPDTLSTLPNENTTTTTDTTASEQEAE